jgi:hypothetical protein
VEVIMSKMSTRKTIGTGEFAASFGYYSFLSHLLILGRVFRCGTLMKLESFCDLA